MFYATVVLNSIMSLRSFEMLCRVAGGIVAGGIIAGDSELDKDVLALQQQRLAVQLSETLFFESIGKKKRPMWGRIEVTTNPGLYGSQLILTQFRDNWLMFCAVVPEDLQSLFHRVRPGSVLIAINDFSVFGATVGDIYHKIDAMWDESVKFLFITQPIRS